MDAALDEPLALTSGGNSDQSGIMIGIAVLCLILLALALFFGRRHVKVTLKSVKVLPGEVGGWTADKMASFDRARIQEKLRAYSTQDLRTLDRIVTSGRILTMPPPDDSPDELDPLPFGSAQSPASGFEPKPDPEYDLPAPAPYADHRQAPRLQPYGQQQIALQRMGPAPARPQKKAPQFGSVGMVALATTPNYTTAPTLQRDDDDMRSHSVGNSIAERALMKSSSLSQRHARLKTQWDDIYQRHEIVLILRDQVREHSILESGIEGGGGARLAPPQAWEMAEVSAIKVIKASVHQWAVKRRQRMASVVGKVAKSTHSPLRKSRTSAKVSHADPHQDRVQEKNVHHGRKPNLDQKPRYLEHTKH